MMNKMRRINYLVILLVGGLLAGCSMERRLAYDFVSKSEQAKVAVYFPQQVEFKNCRGAEHGDTLVALKDVDKALFLQIMHNSYLRTLEEYKLELYTPDDDNEIQVDSMHWLVSLSNMEVQEMVSLQEDSWIVGEERVTYELFLNTVNTASWFELNNKEWSPLLYVERELKDDFDSKIDFSYYSGAVNYSYYIDTIQADDVYSYAVFLGKLYAGYTYDYFLNAFVRDKMLEKDRHPSVYYRYDPYMKQLQRSVDGDRFVVIHDEDEVVEDNE